ncbi:MAG: 30S ribosomal protein S8 [Alphaproteobacteria bacterium]
MTMSDPIADMLTRIRNAQGAKKKEVFVPCSVNKKAILDVLALEGYIRSYGMAKDEKGHDLLKVELKYVDGGKVIQMIRRVSKPGRRVYSEIEKLPFVYNGLGIYVLSTSKGVMSDAVARKENVGGEVLCAVF